MRASKLSRPHNLHLPRSGRLGSRRALGGTSMLKSRRSIMRVSHC